MFACAVKMFMWFDRSPDVTNHKAMKEPQPRYLTTEPLGGARRRAKATLSVGAARMVRERIARQVRHGIAWRTMDIQGE